MVIGSFNFFSPLVLLIPFRVNLPPLFQYFLIIESGCHMVHVRSVRVKYHPDIAN